MLSSGMNPVTQLPTKHPPQHVRLSALLLGCSRHAPLLFLPQLLQVPPQLLQQVALKRLLCSGATLSMGGVQGCQQVCLLLRASKQQWS